MVCFPQSQYRGFIVDSRYMIEGKGSTSCMIVRGTFEASDVFVRQQMGHDTHDQPEQDIHRSFGRHDFPPLNLRIKISDTVERVPQATILRAVNWTSRMKLKSPVAAYCV